MYVFSKCISVNRTTQLLFLIMCLPIVSIAQVSYSNRVVVVGEDEFLPECRGEVLKQMEGEKAPLMEKIYDAIASWESLKPPKGIEARFAGSNNLLEVTLSAYLKQGSSKTVKSGATLMLYINDPARIAGSPVVNNIYLLPEKVADFYGYPVYQNTDREVSLISKIRTSPFVPVTRGEYLQQLIEVETKKLKEYGGENTDNDMDKILAEMEKAYNELLKTVPSAASELKVEIEKFRTDKAKQGTSNETDDLLTSLKKELDKLTPAERDKPARYSPGAMEKYNNLSGLIPDNNSDEGDALVKIAPEFSGLVNEKSAIRFLVVSWNVGDNNSTSDKPRLYNVDADAKGFDLDDYYMARLYRQQKIWNDIFNLVQ
ncbi:MAG: hypothetical protein H6Q19_2171 [Bacteroidetes bacterium]|nr:hypothetical protein [Bacteroidota bacterium]